MMDGPAANAEDDDLSSPSLPRPPYALRIWFSFADVLLHEAASRRIMMLVMHSFT